MKGVIKSKAQESVSSCHRALDMTTPITAFTALIDIAEDEQVSDRNYADSADFLINAHQYSN